MWPFVVASLTIVGFCFAIFAMSKKAYGVNPISVIILMLFTGVLFFAAWKLPGVIHEEWRDYKRAKAREERIEKRVPALASLKWGPNQFKLYAGSDPSHEKLQQAVKQLHAYLLKAGVKGTEEEFRQYITEKGIPIVWTGTEWVRDDARWSSQWKQ